MYPLFRSSFFATFLEPLTDAILHRIPAVEKAEIRQMINGPESFTPDAHAILGEAPEVSIYCSKIATHYSLKAY